MTPIFIKAELRTHQIIYINLCHVTAIEEAASGWTKIYQQDGNIEIRCDITVFIDRIEKYLISES